MKSSWHVATAAEAFAAGQFARCGWNVSVQYGPNQPEFDLMVSEGERMLKVSVKGSKDGAWGLTQSHISKANYHGAIDSWLKKHSRKTVFCLVQFKNVEINGLPRMYLATPKETAIWLKTAASGRGVTVLSEKHVWSKRAKASGTTDAIPDGWKFTEDRLNDLATTAA
jgi:hypothetical protein